VPNREQILASLTQAANDGVAFAMVWHLLFAVAVVAAAAFGWRPSNRLTGVLLAAPLASVSVSSWVSHNPFNGAVFAALTTALLAWAAMRGNRQPVSRGARWAEAVGVGMLAFGWLYPHFLVGRPPLAYLVAAPLGLIPCPTLSAVVGVALVLGGLDNREWSVTLASASVFYALFGVVRLAVWIDVLLLVGAASLLLLTARQAPGQSR
jgi:hypothetical protein